MRHLTYTDRLKIEWLLKHGATKGQISQELGCCLKTIYNEINRGGYWHTDEYAIDHWRYSADIAQQDHDYKATVKGRPDKLGRRWDFIYFIENQIISKKASPAVALHRWRQENKDFNISLKTLYRYIDSGLYFPNLTTSHLLEKRRKRPYHHVKAKRPPRGTSIEKRPASIGQRDTFGHWEMDTVIGKAQGKNQVVLVLTERLTRYEILLKLRDKTSRSVVSALSKLERRYDFPAVFKTITVDNGCEFQDCHGMEYDRRGRRRTTVYYCHPYSSYERGSNERMNRMIRRFLPKGQSLAKVTQRDCDQIQTWLNVYPRKVLNWNTPQFLFDSALSIENISQVFL